MARAPQLLPEILGPDRNKRVPTGHSVPMAGSEHPRFDDSEYSRLFEQHYDAIRRYVVRRVDGRDGVDDIVAEAFIVAWRRRDEIPKEELPWLYGVCRNVLANHRRGERRRMRLWGKLAAERPVPGRSVADAYAERSAMSAGFAVLTEREREVLRLVAWEGLSGIEAAIVLGCTPAQVRVRFHRAKAALAQHLAAAGHEGTHVPPAPRPETRTKET